MSRPTRTSNHHHGDGDGWVQCSAGHRHWGLYGAAGLLAHRAARPGVEEVLLQHRVEWSHFGGTWGLLGGARLSTETVVQAALREAAEEGAVAAEGVRVDASFDDDHGGWRYTTVLATASADLHAAASGGESLAVAWHPADTVQGLPLHPGFAASWPELQQGMRPLTVVVDAANVVGSRPDGWWKDRAGASRRLIEHCVEVAREGMAAGALPDGLERAQLGHWWPRVVVVLEGAARAAAGDYGPDVSVRTAPASGDDAIVEITHEADPPVVVVTADRELRSRVRAAGATPAGPRWWWNQAPA